MHGEPRAYINSNTSEKMDSSNACNMEKYWSCFKCTASSTCKVKYTMAVMCRWTKTELVHRSTRENTKTSENDLVHKEWI